MNQYTRKPSQLSPITDDFDSDGKSSRGCTATVSALSESPPSPFHSPIISLAHLLALQSLNHGQVLPIYPLVHMIPVNQSPFILASAETQPHYTPWFLEPGASSQNGNTRQCPPTTSFPLMCQARVSSCALLYP